MRPRPLPVVSAFAITALLVAAGFAYATSRSSQPPAQQQATPRAAVSDTTQLDIFQRSFEPTAGQLTARERLSQRFEHAPAGSILGSADFSRARPVAAPGSADDVWLVPTSDGGLCAFTPTGDGSFGSSCATLEQFNSDGMISAAGGASGPLIVTVVEPNGVADPVVAHANGERSAFPLRSNVAVATAEEGDSVTAGGLTLTLTHP